MRAEKSSSRVAATSCTSSSLGLAPSIPQAILDTSDNPATRMPQCRAAMTSSQTDMATVSAPKARNARISARRFKAGAQKPQIHSLPNGNPQVGSNRQDTFTQRGIVGIEHGQETRGHFIRRFPAQGVSASEVDVVAHRAEVSHAIIAIDGASGICGDKRMNAQRAHKPNRKGHLLRRKPQPWRRPCMASTRLPATYPATNWPTCPAAEAVPMWGTAANGTRTAHSMQSAKGPSPDPRMRPTSAETLQDALPRTLAPLQGIQ